MSEAAFGETPRWTPRRPEIRPLRLVITWLVGAVAFLVAATLLPGAEVRGFGGALIVSLAVALLNAIVPPLLAAIRLPWTLAAGFLLILIADALILLGISHLTDDLHVSSFWSALGVAIVASGVGVALSTALGTNDDDMYSLRVIQRVARKSPDREVTDRPGIVFLEIDGLALPVLQRAMRDGHAPNMQRWLSDGTHHLAEWETDLSSQTGASQAGILLGSNENIPAFRWVDKETGRVIACSSPTDCAELEREHSTGNGLLAKGGASRGNLFSGDADYLILTVSRMEVERKANPGYRAFLSNGFNVARSFTMFLWEIALELSAAARERARDVRPRGHRGGTYPLLRAAMCVVVRDLIVYGVLTDMMAGRPAVYATFSSYDEVAHHSGLERADTMEALRKLDQQFGRIERSRRYAARPYEIVVLSDHGQTQGATFKQRNGYGLSELVERNLARGSVTSLIGGDEQDAMVGHAIDEATGAKLDGSEGGVEGGGAIVLGSGNLGLVYLMEEPRRLTLEEIEQRHPDLLPALTGHPHIGWVLVNSSAHGPVVLGGEGRIYLEDDRVEGQNPLAPFEPGAPRHLQRTNGFANAADITIGSFYDHALEEGCAFEELISFHGGLGGPQTRPFIFHPATLALDEPIVGAAAVHRILADWRQELNGS